MMTEHDHDNNKNEGYSPDILLEVFNALESIGFRFLDYHEDWYCVYLCESSEINYVILSQKSFVFFKYIII